jgi:hypothetical protein
MMKQIILTELMATNENIFKNVMGTATLVAGMFFGMAPNGHGEIWTYTGKSMVPAMPRASASEPKKIEVVPKSEFPWEKLEIGMVVVFKRDKFRYSKDDYTIHRLIKKIDATHWWTKGDANPLPDNEYVTPENYVGVVKNVPAKK